MKYHKPLIVCSGLELVRLFLLIYGARAVFVALPAELSPHPYTLAYLLVPQALFFAGFFMLGYKPGSTGALRPLLAFGKILSILVAARALPFLYVPLALEATDRALPLVFFSLVTIWDAASLAALFLTRDKPANTEQAQSLQSGSSLNPPPQSEALAIETIDKEPAGL